MCTGVLAGGGHWEGRENSQFSKTAQRMEAYTMKTGGMTDNYRAHTNRDVQQRTLLRRVLRRVLETAFEKVLRRVLRRCLAVGFNGKKGS